MSLCALNSALTYISPSNRCSIGSFFRCVRSIVLYKGIGGKSAAGAGRKGPFAAPASVAVASNLEYTLIMISRFLGCKDERSLLDDEFMIFEKLDDLSLG